MKHEFLGISTETMIEAGNYRDGWHGQVGKDDDYGLIDGWHGSVG